MIISLLKKERMKTVRQSMKYEIDDIEQEWAKLGTKRHEKGSKNFFSLLISLLKKQNECSFCQQIVREDHVAHVLTVHEDISVKCPHCPKTRRKIFDNFPQYMKHVLGDHHGGNEGEDEVIDIDSKTMCPICWASLDSEQDRNEHLLYCHYNGLYFQFLLLEDIDQSRGENEDNVTKMSCVYPDCSFTFISELHLREHLLSSHLWDLTQIGEVHCRNSNCLKIFKTKEGMLKHYQDTHVSCSIVIQ